MANLKGSSFEKQLKDMNFKLFSLGDKKTGDSLTHSHALLVKRDMYFKDFAKHLESQNLYGKFNQLLTESNLNSFLNSRLSNLGLSSRENYISGFNSLLNAFREVNVSVSIGKNYFKNKYSEIKQVTPSYKQTQKRGLPSNTVLRELKEIRYESFIIGKIMLENGFRISEVMKLVTQPSEYVTPLPNGTYKISNLVGKGGKIYHDKLLSPTNFRLISNMENIPSKSAFHRDLKLINENLRAHDFRYQYSKNLYNDNVSLLGDRKALELVSKALNHNRIEISKYYLSRT